MESEATKSSPIHTYVEGRTQAGIQQKLKTARVMASLGGDQELADIETYAVALEVSGEVLDAAWVAMRDKVAEIESLNEAPLTDLCVARMLLLMGDALVAEGLQELIKATLGERVFLPTDGPVGAPMEAPPSELL